MIINVYKPKIVTENGIKHLLYYIMQESLDITDTPSYFKVIYKCDSEICKTPNKLYSINRQHLSEKRSKTVNEKICEMTKKLYNKGITGLNLVN